MYLCFCHLPKTFLSITLSFLFRIFDRRSPLSVEVLAVRSAVSFDRNLSRSFYSFIFIRIAPSRFCLVFLLMIDFLNLFLSSPGALLSYVYAYMIYQYCYNQQY